MGKKGLNNREKKQQTNGSGRGAGKKEAAGAAKQKQKKRATQKENLRDKLPEKIEELKAKKVGGELRGPSGQREISTDRLEEILDSHRIWVKSKGHKGKRADLSSAFLREVYLQGVQLRGANLHSANLQKAELQNSDLFLSDMRGIDLLEGKLVKADLKRAKLKGGHLDSSLFVKGKPGRGRSFPGRPAGGGLARGRYEGN